MDEVDRLCRVRVGSELDEAPFRLDQDGYLDPPGWFSPRHNIGGPLVAPVALSQTQSFALLGEPGSGKTFVLDKIYAHWVEQLGQERVFLVDAMDLTESQYPEMLGSLLTDLPDGGDGPAPDGSGAVERVVIVDQLDESPILKSLAGRLDRSLRGRRTAGLRLVLACRQMNYPLALDAQLKQLLTFGAADLAPLTREQATALADAEGVSGEALTRAASERGVAALASIPLTLLMLCEMFRSGDLVGTAVDIFGKAVARSADKFSNPDVAAGFIPALGRNQRLAISQRLAAQLLLTGRRNIWTGDGPPPRDTDLDLGSAATGMEGPSEARFEVTQQLVQQTLGCAIFAATGDGRTAFRHSSIAAFLAAEHLLAHDVPEGQLRQLLLVEQTFGDTWLTIPTPLRETAAWLIALAPQKMTWLLATDPLSLTAYSSLVDSDEARALLVAKLIESADDAYLSDSWWRRRGSLKLVHPGLGGQVLAALNEPEGDGWRSWARLQLLLELAENSGDPLLAEKLREIAFTDGTDARSRRLAVDAFAVCCPDRVSELRELLDGLQDAERAGQVDPDDELRSALLRVLWPAHLSAAELIAYLTPRRNESLFGGYAAFLWSGAARDASDEQVVEVLGVLAAKASEGAASGEEHELAGQPGGPELARDLVIAFVDRALTGPFADDAIPTIARVLAPFTVRSMSLTIPAALDESQSPLDADEAMRLRRLLAVALAEQADDEDSLFAARDILHGWQAKTEWQLPATARPWRRGGLLDKDDFRWLAAQAEARLEHDRRTALVIVDMAGQVLDTTNADDYERAYELHKRIGPDAQAIAALFTAIRTDSWAAKAWRRDHDLDEEEPWDGAEGFVNEAQELLSRIEAGEPGLFSQLAYMLQFDARTGKGHPSTFDDDLLFFPGVPVLGSDGPDRLRAAARAYLANADDERDRWLGTTLYDPVPWAGYLAVCILDRDPANETPIPFDRWVGAVISYLAASGSDAETRHTRLVNGAAAAAPEAFADAFDSFVRRTVERGNVPYGIHALDTTIDPIVGARLLTTLRSIRAGVERRTDADLTLPDGDEAESHAVQAWRELASLLIRAGVDGATDEAQNTLTFMTGTAPSQLTLAAVTVLMSTAASSAWPTIRDYAGTDITTAQPVIYAMARDSYPGINLATLSDDDLVAYYLWLRELLPQSEDVNPLGVHCVEAREDAQRLRGRTLETLSQRATPRTLELLRDAITTDDAIELVAAERRIRSQLAEIGWRAPRVEDLTSLVEDPVRRLVRTDAELARLITETLTDVAENLASHGDLLWDRVPTAVAAAAQKSALDLRHPDADPDRELWSPKLESSLSEYLANQLDLRLARRRVVVNREVVVRPTDAKGAGERVDLLVQHGSTIECVVPVEIKGHWNDEVETSLTTQLADRYLPDTGAKAGVYVVGWWPIPQWSVKEARRRNAAARTEKQLRSTLTDTAADLSRTRAVSLIPFVLRIPRPARNTPDN